MNRRSFSHLSFPPIDMGAHHQGIIVKLPLWSKQTTEIPSKLTLNGSTHTHIRFLIDACHLQINIRMRSILFGNLLNIMRQPEVDWNDGLWIKQSLWSETFLGKKLRRRQIEFHHLRQLINIFFFICNFRNGNGNANVTFDRPKDIQSKLIRFRNVTATRYIRKYYIVCLM